VWGFFGFFFLCVYFLVLVVFNSFCLFILSKTWREQVAFRWNDDDDDDDDRL
jgi:hypothetical protein